MSYAKYFLFLKARADDPILSLGREHSPSAILLDSVVKNRSRPHIYLVPFVLYQKVSPALPEGNAGLSSKDQSAKAPWPKP